MRRISDELQVEIDDVYGCPGRCPGCVLSANERKTRASDMTPAVRERVLTRLSEYIPTLQGLERINLVYGIADHLLMPDDYLGALYEDAATVIEGSGLAGGQSTVFMTTALVGRSEHIRPRLARLAARVRTVPLVLVTVLDPALLSHPRFGGTYEANLLAARDLFGQVDLTINLSAQAVATLTPDALHDFAARHGIREVTINWTPTPDNLVHTRMDAQALADWLIRFDQIADQAGQVHSSYREVLLRAINAIQCAEMADAPQEMALVSASLAGQLQETVTKSIQFDHTGNLFPKFEAVGDVPHSGRFGYPVLGNVADAAIADLLSQGMIDIERRVLRAHLRTRACARCPHAGFCGGTGFHVYNDVLRDKVTPADACPHAGQALFAHFLKIAQAADQQPAHGH